MTAATVLVIAEDAAAAAALPDVDARLIDALLIDRAASWAARVAPGRALLLATDADVVAPDGLELASARGDGRGERIAAGAQEAFDRFGGPLLIVSAAFPCLGPEHDRAALDDLANGCDVTIGPSTSGDWFLLGLRTPAPALLDALAAQAGGADTLRAAALAGLALGLLRSERPLRDAADAEALRADPLAPPELVAALGAARNTI